MRFRPWGSPTQTNVSLGCPTSCRPRDNGEAWVRPADHKQQNPNGSVPVPDERAETGKQQRNQRYLATRLDQPVGQGSAPLQSVLGSVEPLFTPDQWNAHCESYAEQTCEPSAIDALKISPT
jgi:hypothetical protein